MSRRDREVMKRNVGLRVIDKGYGSFPVSYYGICEGSKLVRKFYGTIGALQYHKLRMWVFNKKDFVAVRKERHEILQRALG